MSRVRHACRDRRRAQQVGHRDRVCRVTARIRCMWQLGNTPAHPLYVLGRCGRLNGYYFGALKEKGRAWHKGSIKCAEGRQLTLSIVHCQSPSVIHLKRRFNPDDALQPPKNGPSTEPSARTKAIDNPGEVHAQEKKGTIITTALRVAEIVGWSAYAERSQRRGS